MQRDAAVAVALALLAVVALGVAAATIDTAVEPDGEGGFGGGGGEGTGIGPDDRDALGASDPASSTVITPLMDCQRWLQEPPVLLGLLAIFTGFFALTYRDTGSLFASGIVAAALFMPIGLLWYVFAFCRSPTEAVDRDLRLGLGNRTDGGFLGEGGGASGVAGTVESVSTPTVVFGLLVVVALVASLILLVTAGRDDEAPGLAEASEEDEEPEPVGVAALGRTAGAAADRIEDDADLDNEVFRAWREMTDHVDVDRPSSTTPVEFAEAAVAAGVNRRDADVLTDLFEEVRYGGVEPTAEREREAVETLRRIEAGYATEPADGEGASLGDDDDSAVDGAGNETSGETGNGAENGGGNGAENGGGNGAENEGRGRR